jgi:hypothetical protein
MTSGQWFSLGISGVLYWATFINGDFSSLIGTSNNTQNLPTNYLSISGTLNTTTMSNRINTSTTAQSVSFSSITSDAKVSFALGTKFTNGSIDNSTTDTRRFDGHFYSVRHYNRVLTAQEQSTNCWVDKYRFALPDDTCLTINIGENLCTDPSIISTTKITCTAPAQSAGYYNLTINNGIESATLTNAYQYEDFTITTLSAALSTNTLSLTTNSTSSTLVSSPYQSITVTTNYRSGYTLKLELTSDDPRLKTTTPNTNALSHNTSTTQPCTYFTPPISGSPITLRQTTTPSTNTADYIWLSARTNVTQPAGNYSTTLTYTLLPNGI